MFEPHCDAETIQDSVLDEMREIVEAGDEEKANEWLRKQTTLSMEVAPAFRRCITMLVDSPDPRRDAIILAMASGMECMMGRNQTEVASILGITKSGLSKAIVDLRTELDLPSVTGWSKDARKSQQKSKFSRSSLKNGDVVYSESSKRIHCVQSILRKFSLWRKQQIMIHGSNLRVWPKEVIDDACRVFDVMSNFERELSEARNGK